MKQPKIEVYKARKGWAWRMVAANGRVLASGEQHTRERDAHRAVATMLETAEKLAHAERRARLRKSVVAGVMKLAKQESTHAV